MMSYDNGEPGVLLGFMVVLEMGTSLTPEFDTSMGLLLSGGSTSSTAPAKFSLVSILTG